MYLTLRHILLLIPVWPGFAAAQGQNLVPNPSFEDVNICTEFKAPCSPAAWLGVSPEMARPDYLYHHTPGAAGSNLLRLVYVSQDALRNYAQTKLLCPLRQGRRYRVTLVGWKDGHTPPEIDLRFDTAWVFRDGGEALSDLRPSLRLGAGDVVRETADKKVFTLQREFVAAGSYGYLVLGTLEHTYATVKACNYIDSIAVTPADNDLTPCSSAGPLRDSLYAVHHRHSIPMAHSRAYETQRNLQRARNLQCITLQVKDHTIFSAAGRAQDPATAALLDSVIQACSPGAGVRVRLTGHAFREGTFNYNKVVGETNAKKIMELLIYMKGFSYDDITVDSKGNTLPRYDTATAEGRERSTFVDMEFCIPRQAGETVAAAPAPAPDTLVVPDVLFRTNSAALNKALYARLDSLLRGIPTQGPIQLQLIGHTDNRGEAAYNQALSYRRAVTVADYLRVKGWENSIRHVSGEGEKRPVAPNETSGGRQRNRRVEIIIYHGSE